MIVIAATACVSILGLDNDKYLSLDAQLCQEYATLCSELTTTFGIPQDSDDGGCRAWAGAQLAKPASDPTHPSVQRYADLGCRSKTTCAEFLDCLARARFIEPGKCGQQGCIADFNGEGGAWRCCSGDHCFEREDASGCLPAAKWSCIGASMDAGPMGDAGNIPADNLVFVDIASGKPITVPLKVSACSHLDVTCGAPVNVASGNNPYSFQGGLPFGFDGYIEAKDIGDAGPDGGPLYMTVLAVQNPPLGTYDAGPAMMMSGGTPMFQKESYRQVVESFNAKVDPMAGHVFAFARDCTGGLAAGVHGDIDKPGTNTLYFRGNNQPMQGLSDTDMSGHFSFVNVPPGLRFVSTFGQGVRLATVPMFVRADCLTFAFIVPQ